MLLEKLDWSNSQKRTLLKAQTRTLWKHLACRVMKQAVALITSQLATRVDVYTKKSYIWSLWKNHFLCNFHGRKLYHKFFFQSKIISKIILNWLETRKKTGGSFCNMRATLAPKEIWKTVWHFFFYKWIQLWAKNYFYPFFIEIFYWNINFTKKILHAKIDILFLQRSPCWIFFTKNIQKAQSSVFLKTRFFFRMLR